MAQHTINLPCIADTYIDENNPNTNYGGATLLKLRGDSYKQYILLNFDISNLPVRKRIISISLQLYLTNDFDFLNDGELYITFLEDIVDQEFSITYNNWNTFGSIIATIRREWLAGAQYQSFPLPTYYVYSGLMLIGNNYLPEMQCHSRENTNPPLLRIIYEDAPPSAPTPTEPIGQYKDSSAIIRFEWQYNSDVGGEQKAFDLQWSSNQVSWNTVSDTTSNTYYDMPADTLPAGNIYWRVRTYNEYDEVGPYCDIQSFYAIGAPAAPVINAIPTNTARPVVSWSAFSQQVYQLQVQVDDDVVYDSGIVPRINTRSHKITAWLADGEYTVRLRIKNEYDLWSDWGSTTVTISTDKPEKPSIALQRSAYGVEITGTGLVYRSDYDKDDYICIGTASGTYFDNTVRSKGEYKYFIRAVSENDTFEDSDIKFIQAELRHALIAPVSDLTNVFAFTRSLNTPPKRVYDRAPGGAYVLYAGRTYPVWEPSEHISTGLSLTFSLRTWAEVESFVALYDRKETVLYRDVKGRKIYGVMSGLQVTEERTGYVVSFLLNQVDYNEEVEV